MALAEYGNAFDIDTDGSGNPILVDSQSGNTIATYDRGSGSWVIDSLSTGELDINGKLSTNVELTIADDDVASIDVSGSGLLSSASNLHYINGQTGSETGLFLGAFNLLTTAASNSAITNQGQTALTGTDGPDGSLNIARDGNSLLIENRTGGPNTVSVLLID